MQRLRVIAIASLLAVACGHARPASAPQSNKLLDPGPFATGRLNLTLVDSTRPTQPNKSSKGATSRTLDTRVWYPAERRSMEWLRADPPPVVKGGHPLVVYSHGFMSFNSEGQYLAEHLASLGYIVVAANYPLTNYYAPGGPFLADVVNQPGDVTFLIDTVLGWSADAKNRFAGSVDTKRIAVAGVSLGGLTTTLAAFHPRLGDHRISAAVSIAGVSSMFGPKYFQTSPKPFLMIAGDIDAIVRYDANAANLQQRAPYSMLVTLKGASHTGYADITSTLFEGMDNPDTVGCDAVMSNIGTLPSSAVIFGALGNADEGIVEPDPRLPCQEKTFPHAIRPSREQDLVVLAATSFLQGQFGDTDTIRQANLDFLAHVLATENPEAVVAPPVAPLAR